MLHWCFIRSQWADTSQSALLDRCLEQTPTEPWATVTLRTRNNREAADRPTSDVTPVSRRRLRVWFPAWCFSVWSFRVLSVSAWFPSGSPASSHSPDVHMCEDRDNSTLTMNEICGWIDVHFTTCLTVNKTLRLFLADPHQSPDTESDWTDWVMFPRGPQLLTDLQATQTSARTFLCPVL